MRFNFKYKHIRIIGQKFAIFLVIQLLNLLYFLKKTAIFLFLFAKKTASFMGRIIFKALILPSYKVVLVAIKLIRPVSDRVRELKGRAVISIAGRISPESGLYRVLSALRGKRFKRQAVCVCASLVVALVVAYNIQIQDDKSSNSAILLSFLSKNTGEVMEKEIPLNQNVELANFFQSAAFIKNIPQAQAASDFKIAAYQDAGGSLATDHENGVLIKPVDPGQDEITRSETETYIVQPGDTIGLIADDFGVSVNTILWANNLSGNSVIRPGQELTILPVTGISHTIKSGETIQSIAQKYKVDAEVIIRFNRIDDPSQIQKGQVLVIPDGQKPYVPPPAPARSTIVNSGGSYQGSGSSLGPNGQRGHTFPWGECTWYVAQRRYVPWSGNAKQWLANARAYGFATGQTPKIGAIVSISAPNSWRGRLYGHVAYVEEIIGSKIRISEMNYVRTHTYSERLVNVNDWRIEGYIY